MKPPSAFQAGALTLVLTVIGLGFAWRDSPWPSPPAAKLGFPRSGVALTFDDGPRPGLHPALLDALDRMGVKATFFFAGEEAERHPELVAETARRGHEVGSHGYSHHPLTDLEEGELEKEISRSAWVLLRLTGRRPRFLRPPGGFFDEEVAREVRRRGQVLALWTNVGASDLELAPDEFLRALPRYLFPGAVIMLHADRPGAIRLAEGVVELVRSRGLEPLPLGLMAPSAPSAPAPPPPSG